MVVALSCSNPAPSWRSARSNSTSDQSPSRPLAAAGGRWSMARMRARSRGHRWGMPAPGAMSRAARPC